MAMEHNVLLTVVNSY